MKPARALRSSSSLLSNAIVLIDVLAILLSGWLCVNIYPGVESIANSNHRQLLENYLLVEGLGCLLMVGVSNKVYSLWRGGELQAMLQRVAFSWLVSWVLVLVWLVLTKSTQEFSRIWLVSWLISALILLCFARASVYGLLRIFPNKGYNNKTVLLIGDPGLNASIHERVLHSSWTGFEVIGSLRPDNLTEIDQTVIRYVPDEIWIGLSVDDQGRLKSLLHVLRHSTANIRLIPDFLTLKVMNHGASMLMGYPMLDISYSPMAGFNVFLKAVLDYIFAAIVVVLISPLLIGIAIAIKITSPGPVVFKQLRHGWNGKIIEIYKFRSMVVHKEDDNVLTQATRHDSRITPLGAFLRRTSLDELPQFINVLQGRLSVVGPRPHAVAHNEQFKELVPRYMLRHKVKPGITGWAQINGFRGETDTLEKMEKRVEYDIHYIENWSIWMDCRIIFMTVFKGFQSDNAY
ncbi:MAG: undecaprenyl-phosphate glucose phosphotransferase [Formivibrio sp.]|nr:undecaprenyl-phosphate glucose phosphotransferase [Formivibrio sp.]